jgi:c-di-GMP-related signal transduction protein
MFSSVIDILDCDAITDNLLAEIKNKINKKYTGQGDFVDINRDLNESLKIIGFKHFEIKIEISKIIDKVKAYNFPYYWEDTIELLTSDTQVMIKNVA